MLQRADRSAWRRAARSEGRWEMVLTLRNCTQGEAWDALQKQAFLGVPPDAELDREWEFAITLAGEMPNDALVEQRQGTRSQTYRDRMMRAMP